MWGKTRQELKQLVTSHPRGEKNKCTLMFPAGSLLVSLNNPEPEPGLGDGVTYNGMGQLTIRTIPQTFPQASQI